MHSPETGGPEMLMELAYRLVVEETPFIQNIRNNVITIITPVVETDGREKYVDNHYFNEKCRRTWRQRRRSRRRSAVADVLGQVRAARQQPRRHGSVPRPHEEHDEEFLEWTPTMLHDLHEAQTFLYSSTGTGPYNDALDPITIDEWWMLAEERRHGNDEARRARRVDVRLLRRLGAELHVLHRARAQRDRPLLRSAELLLRRVPVVSRAARRDDDEQGVVPSEPAARLDHVEPAREHEHPGVGAALLARRASAKDKEMFLENYWLKNKRAVEKGTEGRHRRGWVIPANQHARQNAAEAVNELKTQGLEFHTANVGVQGRQRAGQRGRLHHPRRPAVPHGRRHVLRAAELLAGQPVAVRRHRLDVPVDAQHHGHAKSPIRASSSSR